MIKQIGDGQTRVSVAVAEANTTRDVVQSLNDALNLRMPEIDERIKFGEQEGQT